MISHLDTTIKSQMQLSLIPSNPSMPKKKITAATPALLWLHGCAKWIHVCHTEPMTLQYRLVTMQLFRSWDIDGYQSLQGTIELGRLQLQAYNQSILHVHTISYYRSILLSLHSLLGTNCFHVGIGIGITNIPMIKSNHPRGNESQLTTPRCDCNTG